MKCPNRADGVHDCTGKGGKCPCGYQMTVPRFGLSVHVIDNKTHKPAVDDCFMTDGADNVADALDRAARKMRELAR